MFPGVDGFHWSLTHIVFLTLFGLVLSTVLTTVGLALWRTRRAFHTNQAEALCWEADFEDLPASARACRHALTGSAPGRICKNAFDCRDCGQHAQFAAKEVGLEDSGERYGLDYPATRRYDRGHTWVEKHADRTLTVGLDDLGERLAGHVDSVEMPPVGAHVATRGLAWTMKRDGRVMRVRAPIDGIVVETGGPDKGWYLRILPDTQPADLGHLLSGVEVSAWLRAELERLQILLSPASTGASLADGGALEPDLPGSQPHADWSRVCPAMFLEP